MKQFNCPDCSRNPVDSCRNCERLASVRNYAFAQPSNINYESNPCAHCPNNPANGGSGFCNCVLGSPKIT